MNISHIDTLKQKLKARAEKLGQPQKTVVVGYTANYALKVHEDLEARHAEGKQAKYLEQPARELANDGTLQRLVRRAVQQGGTIDDGLLLAGLAIQRASQKVVPIDTGNLRASAFTEVEER